MQQVPGLPVAIVFNRQERPDFLSIVEKDSLPFIEGTLFMLASRDRR
jgi:hypothetical protein